MMPDYFTRPIQSDRMRQDYGNSGLRFDGQPKRGTIRRLLAGAFLFSITAIGFVLAIAAFSTSRG
jgi:hypothetical protein